MDFFNKPFMMEQATLKEQIHLWGLLVRSACSLL